MCTSRPDIYFYLLDETQKTSFPSMVGGSRLYISCHNPVPTRGPNGAVAFGPQYYNPLGHITHAAPHLFDAAIIVTPFILEVVVKGRERELAGMLIVLHSWRLVKLVGGESR